MKKIISMILILVLFAISPVLAIFCNKCGKELPAASNFCPFCGKEAVGAFQKAPPMTDNNNSTQKTNNISQQNSNNSEVITSIPVKTNEIVTGVSANDYEIVDQIESLLTNNSCDVADIRSKELLIQYNKNMLRVETSYPAKIDLVTNAAFRCFSFYSNFLPAIKAHVLS